MLSANAYASVFGTTYANTAITQSSLPCCSTILDRRQTAGDLERVFVICYRAIQSVGIRLATEYS